MPMAKKDGIRRPAGIAPAQRHKLPEPYARIAALAPIPALLRELHCDPQRVLAKVGLDPAAFDRPDDLIPFATGGALFEESARSSGLSHFGLLVGERFDLSMLGVLGQLMRNSASVREALLQFVRHLHLADRGAVAFLVDLGNGQTALGYVVYRHDTPGIAHIYDLAMAVGCRLMRHLCGPSWRPAFVSFAHGAPTDVAPYRRVFRCPVLFDAAHSQLVFASRWLDRPLTGADSAQHVAAERVALAAEQGADGDLVERVRRAVQGLVMSGEASSQRISALLGIHERVLRRRLHADGTTIKELIGTARFEIARQLLRQTHLTLAEIATVLGYADATTFSRAFRGWANTTPNAWRCRAAADAGNGRLSPAATG
jgi:AraC-like DNA-binding protein